MKHIAQQFSLALFTTPDAKIAEQVADSVTVAPRYQSAKDAGGKVLKDKKGKAKIARDENGNPILTAQVLSVLPKTREDGPSLKSISGFSGQELMKFDREVRNQTFDIAIAKLMKARAEGSHTFGNMRISMKNGNMTLVAKAVNAPRTVESLTDEELMAVARQRGLVKDEAKTERKAPKANGKGNGKPGKNTPVDVQSELIKA